jgi:hypothetical protein
VSLVSLSLTHLYTSQTIRALKDITESNVLSCTDMQFLLDLFQLRFLVWLLLTRAGGCVRLYSPVVVTAMLDAFFFFFKEA